MQWDSVQQISGTDEFTFHTRIPFELSLNPNTWWAAVVGSNSADIASSLITGYDHCSSLAALSSGMPIYPSPVVLTGDTATRAATLAQLKYNVRDWIARFGNLEFAHIANYVPLATPNVYPGYAALSYVNDPVYVSYMKQLLGNFQTASVGQSW